MGHQTMGRNSGGLREKIKQLLFCCRYYPCPLKGCMDAGSGAWIQSIILYSLFNILYFKNIFRKIAYSFQAVASSVDA